MSEHQQMQQSGKSDSTFQKQAALTSQTPVSHPASIIQRARINPKSLTAADVLQLQRTVGNRAVVRLLSEIRNPSKVKQATVQRQEIPEEEEPLQGKMIETIQRQEIPEEEEPLQGKFENKPEEETCPSCMQRQEIPEEEPLQGKMIETVQRQEIPEEEEPLQKKSENNTGMPDNLKAGVENLSGIDMSDVRVHYNSSKPAEVGALAYTQGTDIHVAPAQEMHLPHEAWHVVQQKQGRVQAMTQMKGLGINDDPSLEIEAERMGGRASQLKPVSKSTLSLSPKSLPTVVQYREPQTSDITGFSENGKTSIFDSLVTYGKIFEKTVGVKNHEAQTVINAYQRSIMSIGNALQAFDYTDVGGPKFPNPGPMMPATAPAVGIVNYLMNVPLGASGPVMNCLNIQNPASMTCLFGGLDWEQTKKLISTWFFSRDLLLKNKHVGLLDPLILRITFHSPIPGQQDWVVDTQFATSATGYIIRVHDGQHDITGSIVTDGVLNAAPTVTTDAHDYCYSSTHVHVPGGGAKMGARISNLTAHQAGDLRSAQHDAFDAFTVQSAEGARFRPVGELGRDATLNANFYTKPSKDDGAHSVTLQWLYANWGAHFHRAYDIRRETMVEIVNAQGVAIHDATPAKPRYNLSTGVIER